MPESSLRTIITNGIVVSSIGVVQADVLVSNGVVAGVGSFEISPGDTVIEAAGSFVLPGGVDFHTHLDTVFRGNIRTADDFASGTAAAVAGGTTTVIDFCRAESDESASGAVARWKARVAAQRPWADYGAHMVLVQPDAESLDEIEKLPGLGITSLKMYMAYPGRMMSDDKSMFKAMQRAAKVGMLVLVHAENGHVIDVLVEDALEAGHIDPEWHSRTRPVLTEVEAVSRASALAHIAGADIYFVHVSSGGALAEIERARSSGTSVHAETCAHYLVFDESMLESVSRDVSSRFVCSPPARSRADQKALWSALSSGSLNVLASDHCPFALNGQKIVEGTFVDIMNGLPGVEQRLSIAHSGVAQGLYSITRMVEMSSITPAKLAGIYPQKGDLLPGSDADIVLLDPRERTIFSASTHHSAADYLPYEGMEVEGAIKRVLVRGRTVYQNGEVVPDARNGSYLHRSAPYQESGEKR